MKKRYILLSMFLSLLPSMGFADSDVGIWSKLKTGGLVILMKHAAIPDDSEGAGSPMLRDPSCKKERNLSEKGKKQAAKLGENFANRRIPIERVLTSPYCRTVDTANIAFGKNNPTEYLSLLAVLSEPQAESNSEQLTLTIGSYSGKGNLILVTHDPNISSISFETVETDSFLVLQPMGGDEFEEIGKITISN